MWSVLMDVPQKLEKNAFLLQLGAQSSELSTAVDADLSTVLTDFLSAGEVPKF